MGVEVVLIGAAIGAGIGAIGGATVGGGGDAIWKGALTGAVGGAVTGGVGSWATGALGGVAGGALAGGAGGVAAGALGTALSGGNGSDYLRNIATGGLSGAALGAAGGYLGGGATNGEMADTISQNVGQADYAAGGDNLMPGVDYGNTPTGTGVGQTTATGVEATITGPTAQPTQGTTPSLADTVSNVSATPQPTSLSTPTPSTTTPDLSTAAFGTGGTTPSGSTDFAGVDFIKGEVPVDAVNFAENTPTQQNAYWEKYLPGGAPENPTELGNTWGKITQKMAGYPSPNTTGKGMGLEDYLKLQGKAQLIGGGVKTLGALATAPETQQNRQQLMDLYNQQNEANQYYQNKLQQSYDNPMGYLGSGEAQATRSAALQKLVAQNAMAGRRTAGSALQNQLMMNQLQNLQNYRQGMPRANYGTSAQIYQNAAQYSPTADIFGGLASGVTPLSLYSLFPG